MSARNLTVTQQQAYDGAKSFYLCFLPIFMLVCGCVNIYWWGLPTLPYFIVSVLTYAISVKLYTLCNQIDTSVNGAMHSGKNSNMQSAHQIQGDINEHEQVQEHTVNKQIMLYKREGTQTERPPKYICNKCQIKTQIQAQTQVQAGMIPYRSRHCPKCQACIFRYDHHCFWIGNCVGYANHRQFYLFLLFQTCNNIFTFFMLNQLASGISDWSSGYKIVVYIMEVLAFGFICFTAYLLLYHSMLMCSGLTTWQHMSRSKISYLNYLPAGHNPFSKGVIKNIKQFWVHGQTPIYSIPSYKQAKQIEPGCNIIQNKYYSCC